MSTIGIIGAGNIGSQVARVAIAAGYDVVIANSRGPETLSDLVSELGPKARAATAAEAAEAAEEFAVVTVPLAAYQQVPVTELAGKIVIDTNNYYFERDGRFPILDEGKATTSGLLQEHLPTSKVVKGFNHIGAASITAEAQAAGTENRRALAVFSDFPEAAAVVEQFINTVGFDTVNGGLLSESWRIERDRPGYVVRLTAAELTDALAGATR